MTLRAATGLACALAAAAAAAFSLASPAAGATASAARMTSTAAPPYTIVHPAGRSEEAGLLAARLPAMTGRLAARLGAPPLTEATLCLMDDDNPAAHAPPCEAAALIPSWAAGLAIPQHRMIVVRADRVGGYPHRQLLSVAAHEAVHLLEASAAGGDASRTPPWFREGVAAWLAHEGEWMDFVYVWTSTVASSGRPLADLERRFAGAGSPSEARVAYAGSFSFLKHLVQRHGEDFPARVLAGVREGLSFRAAFARAAGGTALEEEESLWAADMASPLRWLEVAGSSWVLWMGMALLVVAAWLLRRLRARRIMKQWEDQEEREPYDGL